MPHNNGWQLCQNDFHLDECFRLPAPDTQKAADPAKTGTGGQ